MDLKVDNLHWRVLLGIITFFIYCKVFSPVFAVTIIVGIITHEYAHIVAAQHVKLKTNGFYILPFLGGISLIENKFLSLREKVFVYFAGPIGGAFFGLLLAIQYWISKSFTVYSAAVWITAFNLFNLFPLAILDGGQIINAILDSISLKVSSYYKLVVSLISVFLFWKLNPLLSVVSAVLLVPSSLYNLHLIISNTSENKNNLPSNNYFLNKNYYIIYYSYNFF
jgi:Zn-dependent protease